MEPTRHEIALAALTVLDAGPVRQIDAAALAGFDSVGLRLRPLLATDSVTIGDAAAERAVRAHLRSGRLGVLEIGVVTITADLEVAALMPLMAFSAEIGARFLVCPVADADRTRRLRTLHALCDAARPFTLVPLVEFNPYSACSTFSEALALAERLENSNVGLCIDAFHLSRSGGHPDELKSAPADLLRLLHFCDAAPMPSAPMDEDAIRRESRTGRLLPGEGSLWLGKLLSVLPDNIPVSVEAPSQSLAGLPTSRRAAMALAAARGVLRAHAAIDRN